MTPTSIISSFQFGDQWENRLQRLNPGGINLGKLGAVDEIGDQVIHGQIGLQEGIRRIHQVDQNCLQKWTM